MVMVVSLAKPDFAKKSLKNELGNELGASFFTPLA
jgi:hypothetical protein